MKSCRFSCLVFAVFALLLSACGGDSGSNASPDTLQCKVRSEDPLVLESVFGGNITKTTVEYKSGKLFQTIESNNAQVLDENCRELRGDSDYGEVLCDDKSVVAISNGEMSKEEYSAVVDVFVKGCKMSDGQKITNMDELSALEEKLDSLQKTIKRSSSSFSEENGSLLESSGSANNGSMEEPSCTVTANDYSVYMRMTGGGVTYKHKAIADGNSVHILNEVTSTDKNTIELICASVTGSYQVVSCSENQVNYSDRVDGTSLAVIEAQFRSKCNEWEYYHGSNSSSSSQELWNMNSSSSSSEVVYSFNGELETFTDARDGQVYTQVQMGDQLWMAQNLRYADSSAKGSPNLKGATWCLGNVPENCETKGALYLWTTAMDKSAEECGHGKLCGITEFPHQGICPKNWHVPTQDEWIKLQEFVGGGNAGYDMLAVSESGDGKDKYGFGVVPTGEYDFRSNQPSFGSYGAAHFWTATENGSGGAVTWYISGSTLSIQNFDKNMGYAVRCVHD